MLGECNGHLSFSYVNSLNTAPGTGKWETPRKLWACYKLPVTELDWSLAEIHNWITKAGRTWKHFHFQAAEYTATTLPSCAVGPFNLVSWFLSQRPGMPQNKVSGSPRHIWHCHGLGFPTLPSISFSLVPWITEDFQCLCWALSACVHFSPQPFAEGKALCKNTPHQRAPLIMPCPLNVYTVQREIKQKLIPKYFHELSVAAADPPQRCSTGEPLMLDLLSEIWNRYSHKLLQAWPCIFKFIYLAHSPSTETTESFFDFLKYFVRALLDSDVSEKLLNPLTLFYRKNASGFMSRKASLYYLGVFPLN